MVVLRMDWKNGVAKVTQPVMGQSCDFFVAEIQTDCIVKAGNLSIRQHGFDTAGESAPVSVLNVVLTEATKCISECLLLRAKLPHDSAEDDGLGEGLPKARACDVVIAGGGHLPLGTWRLIVRSWRIEVGEERLVAHRGKLLEVTEQDDVHASEIDVLLPREHLAQTLVYPTHNP